MSDNYEQLQGAKAFKSGYSIHYNPYRHKGSGGQYQDWEKGWDKAKREAVEKV